FIKLDHNQPGPGGTFMFALDSAAAVQIYYRNNNGTAIDTGVLQLPSILHAAQITHSYAGTAVQTELGNTTTSRKLVYLQGLGGLRAKISFPYLKNIIKTLGSDIVVNRAELVITANPGSTVPFMPARKLALYRYDLANQRALIEDASPSDPRTFGPTGFGGFYNAQTQQYHFLITAYVQDLMRGLTSDLGTFIGVVPNDLGIGVAATAQVDGRTVAVGADKTSPVRIKLNIIYTKIAK
ncbi:MAG TPA: DUF4270 family protein, partial [Mucilaginibacter sp.]|nr:DUF4270 family protein [Mucilaginibacter sp.]